MHLAPEMRVVIERLHVLPKAAQERLTPQISDYLTRLEELRKAIRRGEASGSTGPGRDQEGRTPAMGSRPQLRVDPKTGTSGVSWCAV